MEQLAIRVARPEDVTAITALVAAAYAKYVERIGMKPAPMLADYEALVREGVVHVVFGGDRLRGVLVLVSESDHLFLENIAVDPQDQGQGLGRQLMTFVDQQATMLGLRTVELYTNEAMIENLAFYARLGFVEVGRRTEDGFRRVFMRKVLA